MAILLVCTFAVFVKYFFFSFDKILKFKIVIEIKMTTRGGF